MAIRRRSFNLTRVILLVTVIGLPLITSRSIPHEEFVSKTQGQSPLYSNQVLLPNPEKQLKFSAKDQGTNAPVEDFQILSFPEIAVENTHEQISQFLPMATQAVRLTSSQFRGTPSVAGCRVENTMCICTRLGWTTIPADFGLLANCTHLDITKNNLTAIPSGIFENFTVLESLELDRNKINRLNPGSFKGLKRLKYLSLWRNRLAMTNEAFPEEVFIHLQELKKLNIASNNKDTRNQSLNYPDVALSELKNLTDLVMDGLFDRTFGDGFQLMTSLRSLTLAGNRSGHCDLGGLTNKTFVNVAQLTKLRLRDCKISGDETESGVFAMLSGLKILDLSWNDKLDLVNVFRVLKAWTETTLDYLDISYVSPRYSTSRHICAEDIKYLPRSLEKLYVRGNSLESVDEDLFVHLPKGLRSVDVSANRFIFGCYLRGLKHMSNLEYLLINGQASVSGTPTSFPPSDENRGQPPCAHNCSGTTDLQFVLPPKLVYLSMHNLGLRLNIGQVNISSNNSLKRLQLSGNNFPRLTGPVMGLHKLENLSLSHSFIYEISEKFFQDFSSLRRLDLGDNVVGLTFPSPPIFRNLTNLQYLNLSFTAIRVLENNFFDGLRNLEELHLAENRLDSFNANLRHMKNLTTLNLAVNFITSLDKNIRDYISSLITNITIDMSNNTIICSCKHLDFLKWMTTSDAFKDSLRTQPYGCGYNGLFTRTYDNYSSIIGELERECTSNYVLFLLTLGGTVVVASMVIAVILYRFRWNLRYLYYAAYVTLKKDLSPNMANGDFRYDVFLSYAGEDEDFIRESVEAELESRGLKVFVHGRDFVVGDYIASNILAAIKTCRKTLVVLTKSLLNSKWCNYELQMANMEQVHTGRQVLIFLLKENLTNRELGMQLLSYIRTNTYIPYPGVGQRDGEPDRCMLEAFWEKLAKDLKG